MSTDLIEGLRQAAPYIGAYRKKTFILLLPNSKNLEPSHFNSIMSDVVLLKKIGINLILVINTKETKSITEPVSDTQFKNYQKQIIDYQQKIKSSLKSHQSEIILAPISAISFGIYNAQDTLRLAELRSINQEQFINLESSSSVLVVSPIAMNKKLQPLFIHPHNLALQIATRLKAEKLIIYQSNLKSTPASYNLRDIESDFMALFKNHHLPKQLKLFFEYQDLSAVKRTHFIEPNSDSLLLELFSVDGSGLLINTDNYEEIRGAEIQDYSLIKKLIKVSYQSQTLIDRSDESIQKNINQFFVIDRDGLIIGCAGLQTYGENLDWIEIYAISIHKDYQRQGRATAILKHLEKKASSMNFKQVFVRTTRIEEWFIERGFKPCPLDDLPKLIQEQYNHFRKSKILIKTL